jgi:hypothetical protein
MTNRRDQRIINFDVVDDHLVRTVTLPSGRTYTHRCTRDIFREVAYAIEERAGGGVTMEIVADAIDAPYTQVNVAMEFMKERGSVEVRHRRTYPASGFLYEDAMIEFMYLAEAPY